MIDKKKIQEISRKTNISEEEIEKILVSVTKPLLSDTHCNFDDKLGVGPSDRGN